MRHSGQAGRGALGITLPSGLQAFCKPEEEVASSGIFSLLVIAVAFLAGLVTLVAQGKRRCSRSIDILQEPGKGLAAPVRANHTLIPLGA